MVLLSNHPIAVVAIYWILPEHIYNGIFHAIICSKLVRYNLDRIILFSCIVRSVCVLHNPLCTHWAKFSTIPVEREGAEPKADEGRGNIYFGWRHRVLQGDTGGREKAFVECL